MLHKKLKLKIQMYFYTISIKTDKVKLIDGVVMGAYSGWDSFLLKYGGEVFERRSIFCMINISLL